MDRSKESLRLKIVLSTIILNIVAVICFTQIPWSSWLTGVYLNLLDNVILIGYTILYRDRLMKHLIVFGLITGFVELAADAWLVDVTHTLDYSIGGGPMIWRSPLWMPMAWEVVAVQFGYLGIRLMDSLKGMGLFLVGLLGALNIPFYEEMARLTKWWIYRSCKMFLHTPYYIILGEFLIVIIFASLARRLKRLHWLTTILSGIIAGLGIFLSYALAYKIFEKSM